ncbi:PAS domain S-box protein [uncultured Phenylobacterium sp.]|uniref:PAS domain S-box protein n=1 Tax=uncultured Phenylobacterium sp. TaxID=349273 RepID=UPI0025E898AE|nr:PAS domain S-box protein [uncultured Phenylobacterium sp.]
MSLKKTAEGSMSEFLADNSGDVIVRVNAAGRVTYISPSISLYGYTPAELLGSTGIDLIHPEDRASYTRNGELLQRGRIPPAATRQHRFRKADGTWVWMEGNPQLIRDGEGRVIEWMNAFRDITERRKTEADALANANLFETAFEYAAIGKALVGLDGRFLRVNESFCRIVGLPAAVLVNLDFQTITHPEDLEADLHLLRQLTAGAIESYRLDKRYVHAEGHVVWVHLAVSMVCNPDGTPRHFVAQVQDQSEQREAEAALTESEARYRLIAENTSDMIVMSDVTGRITYVSCAIRRAGWEPEEFVGTHSMDNVHPDDVHEVSRVFGRMLRGEPSKRVRWRGRDGMSGEWQWYESNPSLLTDPQSGEPTGFLDVVRDVGLQVEQETALAAARAAAEAAVEVKSQFLANMSHEIRTPLTAVVGFTGLLKEDPSLSGAAAGYVAKISAAGNALLAIVNDILDFSKLEAGRIEIRARPTDVVEVCRETLGVFSPQADAKGLSLQFAADPSLLRRMSMIDSERLRQMLVNLLGNAVKFTETGAVGVRVLSAADPDQVVIEVTDTGPGVDPEAQTLLFQRFTQIDGSMTRRHGGAGLGLAICKGLSEAMGGSIGVDSQVGEGSTFRLVLPIPPADLPQTDDAAGEIAAIDGTRVFVVDDNPVNRELARKVLEAAGADVTEASGGLEALERLSLFPVDVVLMDLRMPGMDGRRTVARLRKAPGPNQDIPVLAFTADAEVVDAGDLDAFDGMVKKPISPLDMYATIARATQWGALDTQEDIDALAI